MLQTLQIPKKKWSTPSGNHVWFRKDIVKKNDVSYHDIHYAQQKLKKIGKLKIPTCELKISINFF